MIIPIDEKIWLTPGGALRKEGWFMTMTFSESPSGNNEIKALKNYISMLSTKYGRSAFRIFSSSDMRILREI